jgi:hypothetical protein
MDIYWHPTYPVRNYIQISEGTLIIPIAVFVIYKVHKGS